MIDMSDIVSDPDFAIPADDERAVVVTRNAVVAGPNGRGILTPSTTPITATVLNNRGRRLQRDPEGALLPANIVVFTEFRLVASDAGTTADILTWEGKNYTVVEVKPYGHFGYYRAIAELIPFAGGLPAAPAAGADE